MANVIRAYTLDGATENTIYNKYFEQTSRIQLILQKLEQHNGFSGKPSAKNYERIPKKNVS